MTGPAAPDPVPGMVRPAKGDAPVSITAAGSARPGRDRSIDAARALAIAGVVGGHWLVTGLTVDAAGGWRPASPLTAMPALAPVSWLLQTLGLFFFTGGFAAARSAQRGPGRNPVAGLARPVGLLLGLWLAVLGTSAALGTSATTLRTVAMLVVSPLWFLLPYLALRLVTGPLVRLVGRFGAYPLVVPAVLVVTATDARWLPGWLAVPAAWAVPWVLGIAVARGRLRAGLPLVLAGAGAMVLLIGGLGYPASAVGVPGDGRSNLDPPSLVAIALAGTQIGVFLLVRSPRSAERRITGALNRAALPIYLTHQSVFVAVTALASAGGRVSVPGLLNAPADPAWIMHRLAWLPSLALVLAAVTRPAWRTTRRTPAD